MNGEEKISKKNPFRVPDSYFDEVRRQIMAKTVERQKSPRHTVYRSLRPFLAVAASLALLITIGYFSTRFNSRNESSPEISQILISEPELFLNELDLLTLENSDLFDGSYDPMLSEDEIIDYLVSEDIDITLILEKL